MMDTPDHATSPHLKMNYRWLIVEAEPL
jgi:hypothetical protein